MLPVGQADDLQRLRVLPVEKNTDLTHCIAAVSHQKDLKLDSDDIDPQLLLHSSAAGFVQMYVHVCFSYLDPYIMSIYMVTKCALFIPRIEKP